MSGDTPSEAAMRDVYEHRDEYDKRSYEEFRAGILATVEAAHARDHAALRAAEALLREWLAQWRDHEDMPSKMADALHVRTALYLEGPEAAALADHAALRERAEVAEAKVRGLTFRVEVACDGYGALIETDVPGSEVVESYIRGAGDAAFGIRAALADRPAGGEGRG